MPDMFAQVSLVVGVGE